MSYSVDLTIHGAELATKGDGSAAQYRVAVYQVDDEQTWQSANDPLQTFSPIWSTRASLSSQDGLQESGAILTQESTFDNTGDSKYLKLASDNLPGDFSGVTFASKEVALDLGSLNPGEDFFYFYGMEARTESAGTDQGAFAFFMDPTDTSVSVAGGSSSLDSNAVPLPPSVYVFGAGLFFLLITVRRHRVQLLSS